MLTAFRSLTLSASAAPALPRIPEMQDFYDYGFTPRRGEMLMITGRSGAQKSGFALWLAANMRLNTLYLSADMSPFQASIRTAAAVTDIPTAELETIARDGGRPWGRVVAQTREAVPGLVFRFGGITYRGIDAALDAWVEVHDSYPDLVVVDNLMDTEGAQADYGLQMDVMQGLTELKQHTGSSVWVLHHATEKAARVAGSPGMPPARSEIKGGLSEKPEAILGVALDPFTSDFNIAPLKQRMGPCDPSGATYGALTARPAVNRFERHHSSRGAVLQRG